MRQFRPAASGHRFSAPESLPENRRDIVVNYSACTDVGLIDVANALTFGAKPQVA